MKYEKIQSSHLPCGLDSFINLKTISFLNCGYDALDFGFFNLCADGLLFSWICDGTSSSI